MAPVNAPAPLGSPTADAPSPPPYSPPKSPAVGSCPCLPPLPPSPRTPHAPPPSTLKELVHAPLPPPLPPPMLPRPEMSNGKRQALLQVAEPTYLAPPQPDDLERGASAQSAVSTTSANSSRAKASNDSLVRQMSAVSQGSYKFHMKRKV